MVQRDATDHGFALGRFEFFLVQTESPESLRRSATVELNYSWSKGPHFVSASVWAILIYVNRPALLHRRGGFGRPLWVNHTVFGLPRSGGGGLDRKVEKRQVVPPDPPLHIRRGVVRPLLPPCISYFKTENCLKIQNKNPQKSICTMKIRFVVCRRLFPRESFPGGPIRVRKQILVFSSPQHVFLGFRGCRAVGLLLSCRH